MRKRVVLWLDKFSAVLHCMMVHVVVQAECGDEDGAGNSSGASAGKASSGSKSVVLHAPNICTTFLI